MWKKMALTLTFAAAAPFTGISADDSASSSSLVQQKSHHHHHHHGCNEECHSEPTCGPEFAYFYLRPSDESSEESPFIYDDESIRWHADVFTVKSSNIFVNDSDSDEDIVIGKSGIYLITYTVFSAPYETSNNWVTFELSINDGAVAGSRFTATSREYGEGPLDDVELVGQVITYIAAGSRLSLVNVSNSTVRLGNDGSRNGNSASIAIQKIAETVQ